MSDIRTDSSSNLPVDSSRFKPAESTHEGADLSASKVLEEKTSSISKSIMGEGAEPAASIVKSVTNETPKTKKSPIPMGIKKQIDMNLAAKEKVQQENQTALDKALYKIRNPELASKSESSHSETSEPNPTKPEVRVLSPVDKARATLAEAKERQEAAKARLAGRSAGPQEALQASSAESKSISQDYRSANTPENLARLDERLKNLRLRGVLTAPKAETVDTLKYKLSAKIAGMKSQLADINQLKAEIAKKQADFDKAEEGVQKGSYVNQELKSSLSSMKTEVVGKQIQLNTMKLETQNLMNEIASRFPDEAKELDKHEKTILSSISDMKTQVTGQQSPLNIVGGEDIASPVANSSPSQSTDSVKNMKSTKAKLHRLGKSFFKAMSTVGEKGEKIIKQSYYAWAYRETRDFINRHRSNP